MISYVKNSRKKHTKNFNTYLYMFFWTEKKRYMGENGFFGEKNAKTQKMPQRKKLCM